MADILRRWLGDIGVHTKGEIFEQEFANGYLFGHVLHMCGLQLNFESFTDSRAPEAMVRNYSMLQPIFGELGIKFNSKLANKLIREEKGVAQRMVYSIWQSVAEKNSTMEKAGKMNATRSRDSTLNPSQGSIESRYFNQAKNTYRESKNRQYNMSLRSHALPANDLMERAHLSKFFVEKERQISQSKDWKERQLVESANKTKQNHMDIVAALKRRREARYADTLRDSQVHAEMMLRKSNMERDELRVELSIMRQREAKQEHRNKLAQLDALQGIDRFESTFLKASFNTHSTRLRDAELLEATQRYMSALSDKRSDYNLEQRDREARRDRYRIDQERAANVEEENLRKELFLETLNRKSSDEIAFAKRVWQLKREADVIKENRVLREEHYAKCRQQDWEECLRREKEQWRMMKDQYEECVRVEAKERACHENNIKEKKSMENKKKCMDIVWQIVSISEKAACFRECMNTLVPKREYRQWMALFKSNDPSLKITRFEGRNLSDRSAAAIDNAVMSDYLEYKGEWEHPSPIGCNKILGELLSELLTAATSKTHVQKFMTDLRLKIAVVGPPLAGSTTISKKLKADFNLEILTPAKLVEKEMTREEYAGKYKHIFENGGCLGSEEIVSLMIKGLEESQGHKYGDTEAVANQGAIFDGFPKTQAQGMLMEKYLSGVDLEMEKMLASTVSRLAPPPKNYLPDPDRPLTSGLDAVFILDLSNEQESLNRALGRRMGPDGEEIHLEHVDPEQKDNVGEAKSIQDIPDDENLTKQLQSRLASYAENADGLINWLKRFQLLVHTIDSSQSPEHMYNKVHKHVEEILEAKDAADKITQQARLAQDAATSARVAREAAESAKEKARLAARDLILTKKAQITAASDVGQLPDSDGSVITEESMTLCRERFKLVEDAAQLANECAENAELKAREAEEAIAVVHRLASTAGACADTKQRIEDNGARLMEFAKNARDEADRACEAAQSAATTIHSAAENLESMTEENVEAISETIFQHGDTENISQESHQPTPTPLDSWSRDSAKALNEKWKGLESSYFIGLSIFLKNLREERSNCLQHFTALRLHFDEFLQRPDDWNSRLQKLILPYNALHADVRSEEAVKAEWSLRADELVESLWESCEARKKGNIMEINSILDTSFLSDNTFLVESLFVEAIQVELDRFLGTFMFCMTYARQAYGLPLTFRLPIGEVDLLKGGIPRGLEEVLDAKKGIPAPDWVIEAEKCNPRTSQACRVAVAAMGIVMNVLNNEEVPLSPKSKVKKGKKEKSAESEPPSEEFTEAQREILTKAHLLVEECLQFESQILDQRLQQLLYQSRAHIQDLQDFQLSVKDKCEKLVQKSYKSECSSASALLDVLNNAISAGAAIDSSIHFQGGYLVAGDGLLDAPGDADLDICSKRASGNQKDRGVLTEEQLHELLEIFQAAGPNGYLRHCDVANILAEQQTEGGISGWTELEIKHVREGLRSFQCPATGSVNWRQVIMCFLITKHGMLWDTTPEMLCDSAKVLERECNDNGCLSKSAWLNTKLWFDKSSSAYSIRNLMWNIFAAPLSQSEEMMDPTALLLYLCPDYCALDGIKKAFAVVARSCARSSRILLHQVMKLIHPYGPLPDKNVARLWDMEAIQSMLQETGRGEVRNDQSVNFDQLMFMKSTQPIACHLKVWYELKDPYIKARNTAGQDI